MKQRIIIYTMIFLLSLAWYYYLFSEGKYEGKDLYLDKTDWKTYEIKVETEKDKKVETPKLNWSEDLVFSNCDNNLETLKDDVNIEYIEKKLRNLKEDKKYWFYERFPLFIREYCKTEDSKKYIFSANDKIPNQLWMYDFDLDLFEPATFKYNIFDVISFSARTWNRNYWDISLEKYYEDYRKDKQFQSWFWKKEWNIVNYVNYWVSLIWHAEVGLMYWPKFLNDWNLNYCTRWLTPAWKLSVCFADVYYKYDLSTNTLYEDKVCSYYIDDNWKINTLQKCFQNTWEYKWYDFVSWTDWINIYQDESKELSIIDIDLNKSGISFWWVIQTNTKYLDLDENIWYINKRFRWKLQTYNLQEEIENSSTNNFKREYVNKAFWENNFLKIWWDNKTIFAVVNGQFFNANKDNTTLSFPVKSNWKILSSYVDNDKSKRTIIIDKSWTIKVIDWYDEKYLKDSNNREVLVWINPNEDFSEDSSLWRTYAWTIWDNEVIFFIAKSKTQAEMKQIALDYWILEQNLVMLDWWPSSQFAYFDIFEIGWWINNFYGWWWVPHFVMIYKK